MSVIGNDRIHQVHQELADIVDEPGMAASLPQALLERLRAMPRNAAGGNEHATACWDAVLAHYFRVAGDSLIEGFAGEIPILWQQTTSKSFLGCHVKILLGLDEPQEVSGRYCRS